MVVTLLLPYCVDILLDISCANPGNPVFTCDKRTVEKAKGYAFDPKGEESQCDIKYMTNTNRKKRDALPPTAPDVFYFFRNLWVSTAIYHRC